MCFEHVFNFKGGKNSVNIKESKLMKRIRIILSLRLSYNLV